MNIVIIKSTESIQHQYEFAKFPPSQIRILNEYKNWPHCRQSLMEMNVPELLQCMTCNLTKFKTTVRSSYTATLHFQKEAVTINCYPDKINRFLELTYAKIEKKEELMRLRLKCHNIRMYYNQKFNCIKICLID